MERLTRRELLNTSIGEFVGCNIEIGQMNSCPECNDSCMYGRCKWQEKANQKLKEYEDLEEQGLLHKAPLKDGTPIWYVLNIFDEVMYVTNTTYIFGVTEYEIGEFGKKFWLSEAEAEKALAEMEK